MSSEIETATPRVTFTMAGAWDGVRLSVPFLPGTAVFASAIGALAAQKGMTFIELVGQSAVVYAGAAQFIALQAWRDHWDVQALVTIAAITATVNMRMLLMSASLRPWLAPLGPWRNYAMLGLLTDASWAASIRYRAEGHFDAGMLMGSGVFLWVLWLVASVAGYLAGQLVSDPRAYALDLVMVFIFAAIAVPVIQRAGRLAPYVMAGAASLAAWALLPGFWFIIVGALAAAAVGAIQA